VGLERNAIVGKFQETVICTSPATGSPGMYLVSNLKDYVAAVFLVKRGSYGPFGVQAYLI
jgi:hypothetical protein